MITREILAQHRLPIIEGLIIIIAITMIYEAIQWIRGKDEPETTIETEQNTQNETKEEWKEGERTK